MGALRDRGRGGYAVRACRPRSVAIVGNAPEMDDQSAGIDAADWVVRFNNASGHGHRAGRRVTHLALVNHGGQMREWLEEPSFLARPAVREARSFLFPFPCKSAGGEEAGEDGRDWTRKAAVRLAPLRAPIRILPQTVHREAAGILRTAAKPDPVPSTGFLVALHLLRELGTAVSVGVHGFGFAGWEGHAWDCERRWFEAMAEAGRLRLHPLRQSP